MFSEWPDIETDSAGLAADADVRLSAEQVDWADIIFVMEKKQRQKLSSSFRKNLKRQRIICLDIPDDYEYMDPDLIALLEKKVTPYLR